MKRSRISIYFTVSATFAACSLVSSAGGSFAQDEKTSIVRPQMASPESSAAAPPAVRLRGGAVDDSAPLSIIQHAHTNGLPGAAFQSRSASIDSSITRQFHLYGDREGFAPTKSDVSDYGWALPGRVAPIIPPAPRLRGHMSDNEAFLLPSFKQQLPSLAPIQPQPVEPVKVRGAFTPSLSRPNADRISHEIDGQLAEPDCLPGNFDRFGRTAGRRGSTVPSSFFIENYGNASTAVSAQIDAQQYRKDRDVGDFHNLNGRLKAPPDASVAAEFDQQLTRAKLLNAKKATEVASAIRAIFRRTQPDIADLETMATLGAPSSGNDICWDDWYARVAKLSEPLLSAAVLNFGGAGGNNTVQVTVYSNHRVEVSLIRTSNKQFDDAILNAYRKLNGNTGLAFPAGSRRTEVTFLSDNEHVVTGDISGVSTQTCKGDVEHSPYHQHQLRPGKSESRQ